MKRRQMISEYLGRLTTRYDSYSSFLADTGLFLRSNQRSNLCKKLSRSLCFSIKGDPVQTKQVLFDGLGPTWHHLLSKEWFLDEIKRLVETTSIRLKVSMKSGMGTTVVFTRLDDSTIDS